MTTLVKRGSGTPATGGLTAWTNLTNAVDGTPPANPATYAVWTNAASGGSGYIEISGYDFSAIADTDTLNSVTVSVRNLVSATARFASVQYQAWSGGVALGTIRTGTLNTAAHDDSGTFACTLAQLKAGTFKVRVTFTRAAVTQSATASVDHADVTADYTITPPAITQAAYGFYADGPESGAVADSYSETNQDTYVPVGATGSPIRQGQSFTGNGQHLTSVRWFLAKLGSPVGNVTAAIYAHSGTFGSSSVGTGSALATSTTSVLASSLSSTFEWRSFDFDGSFTLVNGTRYVVAIEASGLGASGNQVNVGADGSASTHAGNGCSYTSSWGPSGIDRIFAVYTDGGSLAAQDTGYTADTSAGDVNLQVRTRLQSTNAVAVPATDDWQLQWEKNTSGTWTNVAAAGSTVAAYASANLTDGGATTNRLGAGAAASLIDTYPDSNRSIGFGLTATIISSAQSFLGDGRSLTRLGVALGRSGAAYASSVTAQLWAATGTFGVSDLPTGAPLATSSTVIDHGTLTTSVTWGITFDFDGTVMLTAGTPYFIGLTVSGASGGSGGFSYGADSTSPTHAGRAATFSSSVWTANLTFDWVFEVYGQSTFVAGKVSETGLVTDLGWTANNYTEVLYSVTLKQADLANSDTLRFRVLRNGATTGLTYTQVPTVTIGAGGPTDRTGTATGSLSLSGTATGVPEVTGVATGTLTVVGVASGAPTTPGADVTGVATGTIALGGVASGVAGVTGAAVGSLAVVGVAVGVPGVTATATGALALSSSTTGTRGTAGTLTGSLTLSGAAAGTVTGNVTGTATGALTVAGMRRCRRCRRPGHRLVDVPRYRSGIPGVRGAATGSLTLAGTATGQKTATATADRSRHDHRHGDRCPRQAWHRNRCVDALRHGVRPLGRSPAPPAARSCSPRALSASSRATPSASAAARSPSPVWPPAAAARPPPPPAR